MLLYKYLLGFMFFHSCISVLQGQIINYHEQESETDQQVIKEKINFIDSLDLYHFEEYSEEGV